MKKMEMVTEIGVINLNELDFGTDSIDVFIPVTTVSDRLKDTIQAEIEKKKNLLQTELEQAYTAEFLNAYCLKWSSAGVDIVDQSLHINIGNGTFTCHLVISFSDKENSIENDISLDVDLSAHASELKGLILKSLIDKFFTF